MLNMKLGIEVFMEQHIQKYKGKRLGLVTNMTGVTSRLKPTIDVLFQHSDVQLTALYGPEHGIRGDGREGEAIDSFVDPYTGVPVYSLYGKAKKPTPEMLKEVDVILFDLQDIGARYYTYIYTMAYVMEACGELGIPLIVLDRPNPIGGDAVEGNLLKSDCSSFVGLYPIPNRHGLTIGELALLYKYEFGIKCELVAVPMEGWKRQMLYDQTGLCWVPPSPNSTGLDMCLLYPGTCLIEGTNLSEGRGTTRPFEYIGAPFIDGYKLAQVLNQLQLGGVLFRSASFIPAYQKYSGERCEGIQVHITDRKGIRPVQIGLQIIETIANLYPKEFAFAEKNSRGKTFFDLLAGDVTVQQHILEGTISIFLEYCVSEAENFKDLSRRYYLYSDV